MRSTTVTVPAVGRLTEPRKVRLTPNGEGRWQVWDEAGKLVGEVWKGVHTYSPPISKGSPIARHHRRVSDWRNSNNSRIQWETRRRALADLL